MKNDFFNGLLALELEGRWNEENKEPVGFAQSRPASGKSFNPSA